jgi:ATP-dependent Lon protease
LERKIAALFRAVAEKIVREGDPAAREIPKFTVTSDQLRPLLGPERYFPEHAEKQFKPGVVTGLAWTPEGGDLLFIETSAVERGSGKLILTGHLGDVMKESAQIALSLVRSVELMPRIQAGAQTFDFNTHDLHIHVPSGAIPKDGPSAGVALLVSLVSLLSGRSIPADLAMTGEITLRGAILPVGGIKEKVLAAHRGGIKRLILPLRNQPDLEEIPQETRGALDIRFVSQIEEALQLALPPSAPRMVQPPAVA